MKIGDQQMRVSNTLKLCLISLSVSVIMACGGGDSTPDTPPIPPPPANLTLNIGSSSVDMNEGDTNSIDFSVSYNGSRNLTYNISVDGIEGLTATRSGETLSLAVTDVNEIINNATITVDVTDGNVSATDSFTVTVANTSFFVTRDNLAQTASNIKIFSENNMSAYNTVIFLTDIDVKTGLLPQDNLDAEIQRRGSVIEATNTQLSQDIQPFIDTLMAFDNTSTASEDDLIGYTEQIQGAVDSYVTAIDMLFDDIRSISAGIIPPIGITDLNENETTYSLFIGNETMGSFTSGAWSFSENYAFLDSVINSNVCYSL
jgi:hypothetical protein